ncbi:9381_t:CDS:2 [Paraglomus occultum]|uniref:9381_t:CDS:1 n=1 Tax=Paraglomus occultum TaxID=144539 RepID=A0A9N9F8Y3_9GLOM|nr:9381_t:CDS:2 [Paraglomus occultum]
MRSAEGIQLGPISTRTKSSQSFFPYSHSQQIPHIHRRRGLEMDTVQTSAPYPDIPKPERPFGLKESKTYHPSVEEFADPIAYIESIRHDAEKYGVVKVVPPYGWKPNFSLDTERFTFKTRLQRVNQMEGVTRYKLTYVDQLRQYHAQQGRPFARLPQLDRRPIDLHRLAKAVKIRSGPKEITRKKQWAEVAREINGGDYSRKCTSASKTIKEKYFEIIDPFEQYVHKARKVSKSKAKKVTYEEQMSLCGDCDQQIQRGERGLLCHGDCERRYHRRCMGIDDQTKISRRWLCPYCLIRMGLEFGFDEGTTYTLRQFKKKADAFLEHYLQSHPLPENEGESMDLESHLEHEFWRLAGSLDETVEIEYGADTDSYSYGGGFPDTERHPTNLYARDPWNLRNLAYLPNNLLGAVQPDIPGMMVPWLYVGMTFSAFCWHVEDHFTYSINYNHWGATKTWYGIPASEATKFENAAKKLLPELFKISPDLLSHLVTILDPRKLVEEEVPVYVIDQRPGQFVVTFPRAYHAGFNHGFNLAEAVNFALPDWISFGEDAVETYKLTKRNPVFAHDQLLIEYALRHYNEYNTAEWLHEPLNRLITRELAQRKRIASTLNLEIVYEPFDRPDNLIQCKQCNTFSYLSQVISKCMPASLCHDHAEDRVSEICRCGKNCAYLRIRYPENILRNLMECTKTVADKAEEWILSVDRYFATVKNPDLDVLRMFCHEAMVNGYPVDLSSLASFIETAEEWTLEADVIFKRLNRHIWHVDEIGDEFLRKWDERVEKCISGVIFNRSAGRSKNGSVYCCCRSGDSKSFMIQCDKCDEWYHGTCVNAREGDYEEVDWTCPVCNGQTAYVGTEQIRQLLNRANELMCTPPMSKEFVRIATKLLSWVDGLPTANNGTHSINDLRKAWGMGIHLIHPHSSILKS